MQTSLEVARRAKRKAVEAVKPQAAVVGVGLARLGGSYVVKVNLREAAPAGANLPETIDGVTIVYEVVGPLRRLAAGDP